MPLLKSPPRKTRPTKAKRIVGVEFDTFGWGKTVKIQPKEMHNA